ncbi:MAG: DNA recombination protein RmuC [Acidobacteriota bacterium]
MTTAWILLALSLALAAAAVALVVLIARLSRLDRLREETERLRADLGLRVEGLDRRSADLQGLLLQELSEARRVLGERLGTQEAVLRDQMASQSQAMQGQTGILQKHMEGTQATLSQVNEKMGMLHQASLRMVELGKEIDELQGLLKAPKARGELGELGLEMILGDMFPKERISYQHVFRDGKRVDAAVRLEGGLLPIDAKFPVEDFLRYVHAPEEERPRARREFLKNVKRKIEDISRLYVRPGEGTLPLALMYLPSEALYYEAFVARGPEEEDLWKAAFEKCVLPLSPGTMAAYLKTVAMGLRAVAVERNAREVLALLGSLDRDMGAFQRDFSTLGTHIGNASKGFDRAAQDLQKLAERLGKAREIGQPDEAADPP